MVAAALLVLSSALGVVPSTGRRAVLQRTAHAAAAAACAVPLAGRASFTGDIRAAESAFTEARSSEEVEQALNRLVELAQDYDGMPTNALRKEVIDVARAKRTALQSQGKAGWDGIKEEQYNRLQRSVDPWRVVELESKAQFAVLLYLPVYAALLAVQQLLPSFFNTGYAAAVALVFGPLLAQILIG